MPFGLCNAAQTFQRFIDTVLRGFDFAYCYIDDILIASATEEEHEKHLRMVFKRLSEYGLTINLAKCVLGVPELLYVGYSISKDGTKPPFSRVEAILNYKKLETIVELRRFLGVINFYRRFIKNAAQLQAPLNAYLQNSKKNDKRPVQSTEESNQAFDDCKNSLALLVHPAENAPLALTTDASDTAIGAVLEQQESDGDWKPLGFFSRKMSPTEQKYSTYDRELLAIYCGIKFFKYALEGRNFVIKTDRKPLIYAFAQNPEKASPRELRQLDFIS